MAKVERRHLLTAEQMARFVSDGFLKLDEIVPKEYNDAAYEEQQKYEGGGGRYWFESSVIREIFELPQVKGIIQSLVGENPGYDHSFLHIVRARHLRGQDYHADSIIDTRPLAFDIQAFYFSHDAPREMGPTLVLPGSHLRRISNGSIARYKNILGQQQLVSKAGTIAFMHHGIWHCAQPNFTDRTRYVFKLRLRPGQEQRNLFNTEGYDSPEVLNIIRGAHRKWQGEEARIEQVQRAKLWRYVCGNDSVDASFERVFSRMGI
jgi:hypothetical protein